MRLYCRDCHPNPCTKTNDNAFGVEMDVSWEGCEQRSVSLHPRGESIELVASIGDRITSRVIMRKDQLWSAIRDAGLEAPGGGGA